MLKSKTAIVTGSTSGIGRGIALALARAGASVVVSSWSDTAEDHAGADEIARESGAKVAYIAADMSDARACRALVAQAAERFGKVDVLVNNAGIQHVSPVETFPVDKWNAIIAINLSSAFHTTAAAVPGMRARGFGRIVNIASAHGLRASPGKAAYVAAKHGVVGLTKTVALELAGTGITCNAVCPGFVLTPLVEAQISDLMRERGLDRDTVIRDVILEKQPSKQFASIEDVAQAVIYLASDFAGQVTGTTLSIDGGWTAQ